MKDFKITFEDYKESQTMHSAGFRQYFKVFLVGAVLIALLYRLSTLLQTSNENLSFLPQVFVPVFALIFFVFYFKGRNSTLKRIYDSQKSFESPIKMTFNEKEMHIVTPLDDVHAPWDHVIKYLISDKIIVLYQSLNAIRIIPLRAFENDSEKNNFLNILNKYSKKV